MNFTSRSLARLLCVLSFAFLICLAPQFAPVARAAQLDIAGPAGSGAFGRSVTALPNGNIVVTDSRYDITGETTIADVGAVYLYNGSTGALISTLTGSTANDQVSLLAVLPNGNYLAGSQFWDNGPIFNAGAMMWCSGTTGCAGTISPANSLVGSSPADRVGDGRVTVLADGNYVVKSPLWNNGAATYAGAVTWCSGTRGCAGAVSPANSLVGSTQEDRVGDLNTVTVLSDGNYVVNSSRWDNGTVIDVGAVTWCSGMRGCAGAISPANSLVGGTANNRIGSSGVTKLTNGNYIVKSPLWDNGPATDAGAATWCSGTTGRTGVVSPANSLVGSTQDDNIGNFLGVKALPNGTYVVNSQLWDNGAAADAGAVLWCSGTRGCTGAVSPANSLVGGTANDRVGGVVRILPDSNYVVISQSWDNGAITNVGAVTWCGGTSGCVGEVSSANSLVGSTQDDYVGWSVAELTNGNYVVGSQFWDNGTIYNVGAATWCSGTRGCTGVVSRANSLVGSARDDGVGSGTTALPNGNYVVNIPHWDNGAISDVGAMTWCSGTRGCTGAVSTVNSLVGSTAYDYVGLVHMLSDGNYVVNSPGWDNGAATDAGAVTWCSGTRGCTGAVSTVNSLVGSTANNRVGSGAMALPNGNYVVNSPHWDNGAITDVGAVTWCGNMSGCVGEVSSANSLVGSTQDDNVGYYNTVRVLPNGNYIVNSLNWDNGAISNAGAMTWCSSTRGCSGAVSPANSLVGSTQDDGVGFLIMLTDSNYVVHSSDWDNGAITDAGAFTLGDADTGVTGPITGANSVRGTAISGGRDMAFAYDAINEQMVVGRPDSNIVSLFRQADTFPPVVSSIHRADAEPTSQNTSVRFTVTFNDAVTGVDASDFRLFTTGNLSGAAITGVSGGETTYTVTVNTGSGAGTLRLDLSDDDTITDAQNNRLGGTGAGNGNFTNGQAYTVPLALTINDVTRAEGNVGTSAFVFTVSLSAPAPAAGVSFDLATADNTATVADNDYEPKSVAGASIAAGSQTFEIAVTVNGDMKQETNETFHVNVSNVAGASVSDGQGAGTLQNDEGMPGGGQVLISEFRLHGPGTGASPGAEEQATDEFIEIYNNSDSDFVVMDTFAPVGGVLTNGWALVSSDAPLTPKFVIPAGTRIPARSHFLIAHGTGYSLGLYPAGRAQDGERTATADASYFVNIPDNTGLALFRTGNSLFFNVGERLDAVGPTTELNPLFKEGSGYAPVTATGRQHSFLRDLRSATPKDTDRNERDFLYVDAQGSPDPSAGGQLGAPGPENSRSAVQRNNTLKASLIEPQASSALPPNRLRDGAARPNATFGTLEIRRRFTNRTRATVNFLRLRVVDITTLGTPNAGGAQADLRWLDSTDIEVATSLGELTVRGTMIETPPGQPHGGGLNSSARIVPVAPLSSGASMDVRILLGVQRNGSFRLLFNIEASEQTDAQTETRTSRLKGRTKQQ